MTLWNALESVPSGHLVFLSLALVVAFGFEFINGFHDAANAVATVIYTRSMRPTKAVLYSGVMNFLGVFVGGTGVAFSIVSLLPVDMLVHADSRASLLMVMSLLLAGVMWNLGTWYLGLPVSSSHTLIGSILGVGLANSLLSGHGLEGLNWQEVVKVGLALLVSPLLGFCGAGLALLGMKRFVTAPRLYEPPPDNDDRPPGWIRAILISTCGAVSLAHGANDGQKGMGLILLVLIGFIPCYYALDTNHPGKAKHIVEVAQYLESQLPETCDPGLKKDVRAILVTLGTDSPSFDKVPMNQRWELRQAILRTASHPAVPPRVQDRLRPAYEFVPLWVVIGTALALGIGTTVGYRRIVITVAERIGKTHLTYGQGAAAQFVAAFTILLAVFLHAPVSTTHVLSSGVAGTMVASHAGVQGPTVRKICLAWVMTLPATMAISAVLFAAGRAVIGG